MLKKKTLLFNQSTTGTASAADFSSNKIFIRQEHFLGAFKHKGKFVFLESA
jgi:hypothetical protein